VKINSVTFLQNFYNYVETGQILNRAVFWVVALCSMVEIDISEVPTASVIKESLSNFGQFLPDYKAQYPRRCHLQVCKMNHSCVVNGGRGMNLSMLDGS
jgi:hypothetical protein